MRTLERKAPGLGSPAVSREGQQIADTCCPTPITHAPREPPAELATETISISFSITCCDSTRPLPPLAWRSHY